MPYCSQCGAKNEQGEQVCTSCGASLYDDRGRRRDRRDGCYGSRDEGRPGEECFGLPLGNVIVGIIFGILILIGAILWILSLTFGVMFNTTLVGPIIVLIFAILIIAGAIYQLRRRP